MEPSPQCIRLETICGILNNKYTCQLFKQNSDVELTTKEIETSKASLNDKFSTSHSLIESVVDDSTSRISVSEENETP